MAAGKTEHARRFYHYQIQIVLEGDKAILVVTDQFEKRFVQAVARKLGGNPDTYGGYKFIMPLRAHTMYRTLRAAHQAAEEEKRKDTDAC